MEWLQIGHFAEIRNTNNGYHNGLSMSGFSNALMRHNTSIYTGDHGTPTDVVGCDFSVVEYDETTVTATMISWTLRPVT
jgi:hypothetical protein